MLFPASCLAAALCLNLASGFSYLDHALRRMKSQYSTSHQMGWSERFDNVIASSRRFGKRSQIAKEMVMDGSDMVMSPEQARRLYQGGQQGRSGGHPTVAAPWKEGRVPIEIAPWQFTKDQKDWIRRGMQTWENLTCVRFVPPNDDDIHKVVVRKIKGCFAGLGMQGLTQHISLDDNCFFRGTIEHELGHTLGLIHEHQRDNRDDYIKINYFAAKEDGLFELAKYVKGAEDKYGLPYDYHSVMHYDKYAFGAGPKMQTIYPRRLSKTDVIGMTLNPSFYDIKLVNLMYNCKDQCKNPPYCPEPCFVNEKCQCFCEKDAPKEFCQDLEPGCAEKAARGHCAVYTGHMLHYCRKSCGVCQSEDRVPHVTCADWNVGCGQAQCQDSLSASNCEKTCNLCADYSREPPCVDRLLDCRQRAGRGECDKDPGMMLTQCKRSCDFCLGQRLPERQCEDKDTICEYLKENGGCESFKAKMSQYCKRSCNNCDNSITLPGNCGDHSPYCFQSAWQGQCAKYGRGCRKSCNFCKLQRSGWSHPVN